MNIPKQGQRFRVKRDLSVSGVIVYGAPCSGGFQGTLPRGEIVTLDYDPKPEFTGCWLKPERYEHFEALFIPERIRQDEEYDHYAISASYKELDREYELVEDSQPTPPLYVANRAESEA
jgi:hypothetical protein